MYRTVVYDETRRAGLDRDLVVIQAGVYFYAAD